MDGLPFMYEKETNWQVERPRADRRFFDLRSVHRSSGLYQASPLRLCLQLSSLLPHSLLLNLEEPFHEIAK